jgi:hypothetical protein
MHEIGTEERDACHYLQRCEELFLQLLLLQIFQTAKLVFGLFQLDFLSLVSFSWIFCLWSLSAGFFVFGLFQLDFL